MFLQETHSKKEVETQWRNEWGGKLLCSHGSYRIMKVEIEDNSYILINIYAPNRDKDLIVFFQNILKIFRDGNMDSEENIIIGGVL